jgi:molecular chaperone GrpE (heat shock protein)
MDTEEATQPTPGLEEIAEDMLDVLQRLGNLERSVQELRRTVDESGSQQRRILDQIRSEVAGDRKSVATRVVFDQVAAALDSLELLGRGLDATRDQSAYAQVTAAVATLANVLLALGYQRFDISRGDPFDSNRMQCFGYAVGEQGVVLEALHPGYSSANIVIRPARVLIADPATALNDTSTSKGGARHET